MDTRSPLKDLPLRNPGQSVREQRVDLLFDKFLGPVAVAAIVVVWAVHEWIRYIFPSPPNPWLPSLFAVSALSYLAWQAKNHWSKVLQLKQAEDGEKYVGQLLDALRRDGYQVFHDIVGDGFNVDHVVVAPAGVLSIETKTWSKPLRGSPKITFDGETLLAAGREPDRDPVVQAKAQANWIKELLSTSTGKTIPVRPVVVFPGWYIEDSRKGRRDVWVLEPKALPAFLKNEKAVLPDEDVNLAAFHLSCFIRGRERLRDENR